MKEIKFDPFDYNNNVYIDDELHIITDNFQLVDLIKEKLGYDAAKFVETVFNIQTLNNDEMNDTIEESNEIAIQEFKDMELIPIFNKINTLLDDNKLSAALDINVAAILEKVDTIKDMLYKII